MIKFFSFFKKKERFKNDSLYTITFQKFYSKKLNVFFLIFLVLIVLVSILGYLISPDNSPYANHQNIEIALQRPGFSVNFIKIKNQNTEDYNFFRTLLFGKPLKYDYIPICKYKNDFESYDEIKSYVEKNNIERRLFLLGTDRFGRDVLSQLIIGSRVSLSVGFIAVFISLLIGIFVGALGGYFGGYIDKIVVWLINVIWSIPTLFLVIAITFALGRGFWQIFIAVGLTLWVEIARLVRGQVVSLREKEYVEAARALGFSHFRIITRHILPGIFGAVIVVSAANFASAILIESGLSFLGIGIQPPMPSWGSMLKENYGFLIMDYAYLALAPGIAIMLLVLSFMIIGNGLRDAMDVKEISSIT